jgi:Fe-S oxidoreductase
MEVLHITQLIHQNIFGSDSGWDLRIDPYAVTYQDPCRLGRHLGVYNAPRDLITAMGFTLVEMQHSRQTSICCGTSGWTACGAVSKHIQIARLREAVATGAEMLLTACIKCQIHLKCAQRDPEREKIEIPIRDLTTVLAQRLGWQNPVRGASFNVSDTIQDTALPE